MLCDATDSKRQTRIESLQDVGLTYLAQLKNAGGRAFGSLGLTYGQAMLLTFIDRGYTTPTELNELLGIVPSALSALVTQLEETGLTKRISDSSDGRRIIVTLTPRGIEACQKVKIAWQENFPVDLQAISDGELQHLVEAARIASQYGLI